MDSTSKLVFLLPFAAQDGNHWEVGKDDKRISISPLPKLYIYDHCPYCVRARMIFGLKKIKHELVFVANDDFDTPIKLIGKKMTPILECQLDGKHHVFGESLDIVDFVDSNPAFKAGGPLLKPVQGYDEIERLMQDLHTSLWPLLFPRIAVSGCLGEMATEEARNTFVVRHPLRLGITYTEAIQRTPEFLKAANALLQKLEPLLHSDKSAHAEGVSICDILLWPYLRSCTLIKGIVYPNKVRAYIDNMSQLTNIRLFDQMAI